MSNENYIVYDAGDGKIVKGWHKGVTIEEKAIEQLKMVARLPFVFQYVVSLPDCHWGNGSAIGTVLPTLGAIVPAAVGVDIGCGMIAAPLPFKRSEFVDLKALREFIERAVPNGRSDNGGPRDIGAWGNVPERIQAVWDADFATEYEEICIKNPGAKSRNTFNQLGTLGTGNHFIELSETPDGDVWIVLHSGSRGLGNKIGSYFTQVAQELCAKYYVPLPNKDLAYLPEGTEKFVEYTQAVRFAQRFALKNRELMLQAVLHAVADALHVESIVPGQVINCHHNYVNWEKHYGKNVMVTRKGAVRAQDGDWGIIPGSMGARTYIVRGLGNRDSFCSCSHGAGRAMGRKEAERRFTIADHVAATEGVECRKDASVLDETPAAYKPIADVMAAQSDLVTPVVTLKQFLCVKGAS